MCFANYQISAESTWPPKLFRRSTSAMSTPTARWPVPTWPSSWMSFWARNKTIEGRRLKQWLLSQKGCSPRAHKCVGVSSSRAEEKIDAVGRQHAMRIYTSPHAYSTWRALRIYAQGFTYIRSGLRVYTWGASRIVRSERCAGCRPWCLSGNPCPLRRGKGE